MLLKELKYKDYDKYLFTLLAPKSKQPPLAALFLFGHEISQIPAESTEPMIGLIKLQWWKDALDEIIDGKPPRPHPILKALEHEKINYAELKKVVEHYYNLLEGQQPQSFDEIENFLLNTDCKIIEQASLITGNNYDANIALSYSLNLMARKITSNSKYYSKFASQPEVLAKTLNDRAAELLPKSNNIFAIIAMHYSSNLKSPRWKLLIKIMLNASN